MTSYAETLALTAPTRDRSMNRVPGAAAALVIILSALYLAETVSGRQALLFLTGVLAGLVLYQASFGFTSAWRVFVTDGRGAGIRAQMLMLTLTSAVFFPILARGEIFGQAVRGSVSPVGVSVVVGAFLFGVGMQLGGGCASGTLYTAGSGNTRMLVTLASFVAGSVIGTAHMTWWNTLPAFAPVSLVARAGAWPGLAISLALFACITLVSLAVERRMHGLGHGGADDGRRRLTPRSAWPLVAGAIGLAVVNITTLLLSGRPWGVTSAFALWGGKALVVSGVDVAAWPYWSTPAQTAALRAPIATDITSVMDIGIVMGALAAACAAGRFAPEWRLPARSAIAAVAGGLMLGYGARLAYGCNIGAYFSGIASGSLHGWVWLAAAFAGSAAGVRLRPRFGLSR
jgi:uncharacterized membrane protein YedE/YeeE